MKRFIVTPPTLPTGITITAIDWLVSRTSDFTVTEFTTTTSGDVFSLDIPITLTEESVYFGMVKFTLSDGSILNSDIIVFTKRDSSKTIDDELYPPIITKTLDPFTGNLVVSVDAPKFFIGNGVHYATSYVIRDIAGNILLKRMVDTENIYSMSFDLKSFSNESAIIIEVKHEIENMDHDNWGRTVHVLNNGTTDIYLSNDVLFNFKPTVLDLIYDKGEYDSVTVVIETLYGEELLREDVPSFEILEVDNNIVLPYTKVKVKLSATNPNQITTEYEKILRVVNYQYVNINNNNLPYYLPFNLGA